MLMVIMSILLNSGYLGKLPQGLDDLKPRSVDYTPYIKPWSGIIKKEEAYVMLDKLETAYHEAGHAVAAFYLNRGIKSVTIKPDEERGSLGSVTHTDVSQQMINALEVVGILINGRTRRFVESQIMVCLAGGLVHQMLTGKEDHEVGSGVELVDDETAQEYAKEFGGTPDEWSSIIWDGDLHYAGNLASKVTGSDEEKAAYLAWLKERTKNLICKLGFMECVKVLAEALVEKETLTGKEVRQIISSTKNSFIHGMIDNVAAKSRVVESER